MTADRTSRNRTELLASLAVVISGSLWGLYWIPLRYVDAAGVTGVWVSLLIAGIAMLALVPVHIWRWRPLMATGQQALLVGLFLGGSFTLYAVSLLMTEVVRSLLFFYLSPIWSTLIAVMWYRERVSVSRAIAIVLGLVGILLVMDYHSGVPLPRNAGDWIAFASGIMWAVGSTISFRGPAVGVFESASGFNLGCFGVAVAFAIATSGDIGAMPPMSALLSGLPLIAAISLVLFLPTMLALGWGVQQLEPGRVGILLMCELIVGTVSAAMLTSEPFGMREISGALLIIAAGAVEVIGRRTT